LPVGIAIENPQIPRQLVPFNFSLFQHGSVAVGDH
jgi:hypothetical protein